MAVSIHVSLPLVIATCICVTSFLIYGFVLRNAFQTGDECDMTWSIINFINLSPDKTDNSNIRTIASNKDTRSYYRLLRFIDHRDVRYTHLIDYSNPDRTVDNQYTFHPKKNHNWCQTNQDSNGKIGHLVLYIPGHEGTYDQARSLGAHGINLTTQFIPQNIALKVADKLKKGISDPNAVDIDDFVYDVYTLDFNGEGAAWHASRLYAQADFVVQSIENIIHECNLARDTATTTSTTSTDSNDPMFWRRFNVTIVAHSIGGLVARKAILLLYEKYSQSSTEGERGHIVKDLITLASPHQFVPFIVEKSTLDFHRKLMEDEKEMIESGRYGTTIVSFSGGLRDELIPQISSFFPSFYNQRQEQRQSGNKITQTNLLSVLAADVMNARSESEYNGPRFGMDHKCIVWCHGLLRVVRELIHVFALSGSQPKNEREELISSFFLDKMSTIDQNINRSINEDDDEHYQAKSSKCGKEDFEYECRIKQKEILLRQQLGYLGSIAFEATSLYQIRPLIILYGFNAIIHQMSLHFFITKRANDGDKNMVGGMNGALQFYFICPLTSTIVFSFFQDNIRSLNKIACIVLVAFAAMTSYYLILYGILPIGSWSFRKIVTMKKFSKRTHFDDNENQLPTLGEDKSSSLLSLVAFSQMKYFIVITSIYFIVFLIVMNIYQEYNCDWILNHVAFISHFFITFVMLIIWNILQLGYRSNTSRKTIIEDKNTKQLRLKLQHSMIASLLLPIFPLFVCSKLIYAWSLLFLTGQIKSIPYLTHQQHQSRLFCDDSMKSSWIGSGNAVLYCSRLGRAVFKNELVSYTMLICVPLYLLLIYFHYVTMLGSNDIGNLNSNVSKKKS